MKLFAAGRGGRDRRFGHWVGQGMLALGLIGGLLAGCGVQYPTPIPPTPGPTATAAATPTEEIPPTRPVPPTETATTGGNGNLAAAPPLPVPPVAAGDWPMYGRDAARTNYNPDETTISPATVAGLVPRWQVDLSTGGLPPYNAPMVAAGRVYAASSVRTGPNFFAFDALSGAPIWSADIGHINSCFGVGIGATAAISGSLIVTGGGDAAYYGLDAATGTIRWQHPLDVGLSGFAWVSPLLYAGRAYVGVASDCDNPSVRGEIRALALDDGRVLASQPFVPVGKAGAGVWNSPALTLDGGILVVATGEDYEGYNGPYNRALVALDPLSLSIRQANQQGGRDGDLDFGTTPVIFHDRTGRTLVAAGHKDETFYAYDLDRLMDGPIWQRPVGTTVGMMPAYDPDRGDGGTLFFVDGKQLLHAVDPATGADRWTPVPVGAVQGHMALANGLIYANASDTGVLVLDETTGTVLTMLVPPNKGASSSGAVVAQGMVYWQSGAYLNAWGLPAPNPIRPAEPTVPSSQ